MTTHRPRSIEFALCGVLVLAACDGTDPPNDLRWQSAHFDYYTRASDDSVCPDLAGLLEDHFAVLRGYLGFDWPAGRKVNYWKYADLADFEAHNLCPPLAGGCTIDSTVESMTGLDTHELVHAYLSPSGTPPPVLMEGAAVALSCTSSPYTDKPRETWDQLAGDMYSKMDTYTVYEDGAWLVGYLLDAYGPGPFMTVYRALPYHADAASMDAAFQSAYGQGLAALWSAALAGAQPRNVCVWQCSRPPIVLGTPFDTTGVCGTDSLRPFTLTAESAVSFTSTGADFALGPCGQINPPDGVLNGMVVGGVMALRDLPAGSYYLEHNPLPGTMAATLAPAALTTTCASATDTAAFGANAIIVSVPSSQPTWFLPLRPPLADGHAPEFEPFDRGTAEICASCDPTTCVDASDAGPWTSGSVVRYTADPTQPFSQFILDWF
jgi:hypothetical protein